MPYRFRKRLLHPKNYNHNTDSSLYNPYYDLFYTGEETSDIISDVPQSSFPPLINTQRTTTRSFYLANNILNPSIILPVPPRHQNAFKENILKAQGLNIEQIAYSCSLLGMERGLEQQFIPSEEALTIINSDNMSWSLQKLFEHAVFSVQYSFKGRNSIEYNLSFVAFLHKGIPYIRVNKERAQNYIEEVGFSDIYNRMPRAVM